MFAVHRHYNYTFALLLACVGVLLMVIAGICAGVGGTVYWPWSTCTGTCPSGANDRGQYITILLFVGLGLVVLFGSVWAWLYWGVAVGMGEAFLLLLL